MPDQIQFVLSLCRIGQILNLYWEKTPESVFYSAVEKTIATLKDLKLIDYMATEDLFIPSGASK